MDFLSTTLKSVDESSGTWTAVASAASVDRDGERVLPRALTWRTPTVPVHAGHNFKVESLVGRATPRYDPSGALLVDGKFGTSDLAQATRRAVLDGSLDSMSIAFIDAKRSQGKDGIPEITAGELISCDWVTIPSNADARVLAARDYGGSPSVTEARRMVMRTLMELAELDIAEARRGLDRIDSYKKARRAERYTLADFPRVLADAEAFLANLKKEQR